MEKKPSGDMPGDGRLAALTMQSAKRAFTVFQFKQQKLFIGIINSPGLVTLLGLWFGITAGILIIRQYYALAISCLMCAGLCDLFDGPVARLKPRPEAEKQFGQQIDSLADMANFVVIPGILGYAIGLEQSWPGVFSLFVYITGGALRLAYFNVFGLKTIGNQPMFAGVPVAYTVLVLPWIYLCFVLMSQAIFQVVLVTFYFLMGIAFVTNTPIPKPGKKFFIIFPVYAVGTSLLMWWIQL